MKLYMKLEARTTIMGRGSSSSNNGVGKFGGGKK